MEVLMTEQRKKIPPHKFTLWIAIGSITMMFAGLTSAYIIKRNQPNWLEFDLPVTFWYSTAVIIISSVTIWLAIRAFRDKEMAKYRQLLMTTFFLGLVFVFLQILGFVQLWKQGITLTRNVSISFLYPIIGLHAIHVIGGIIALLVMFLQAFSKKKKTYSVIPVEMMSTYWHFVDLLWIYLLLFLLMIR